MRRVAVYSFAVLLGLHPSSGHAQWQTNGTPVCTAANAQGSLAIVSDAAGGAIVTWDDSRTSSNLPDIYVQRINAAGIVQWTGDGVPLCSLVRIQDHPVIASDGAGGAIVTWEDTRTGTGLQFDVYAQRIDASGVVRWPTNGVAICIAPNNQRIPAITASGAGGAIAAWYDPRPGNPPGAHFFAQRVNASGVVQWATDGVLLNDNTDTSGLQSVTQSPRIVGDDAGGAIVTWSDSRLSTTADLYMQRVDSTGTVQWASGGVPVCTAAGSPFLAQMIPDGVGGAIVTWEDDRNNNSTNLDIYAQRVNASGSIQWPADAVLVCGAAGSQEGPQLVSDGAGGAIVTWADRRDGFFSEILAQRVDGSGVRQWTPADGVLVSSLGGPDEISPTIVSDGAGGAIVTWTTGNVRAQRIDASGAVQWAPGGVVVANTSGAASLPVAVPKGAGGMITAWLDTRNGNQDIFAQGLDASGRNPTGVGDVLPISTMTLSANWPNPFSARTMLSLDLPSGADVAVDVADVSGRIVRRMDLGHRSAGTTPMSFDGRDNLGHLLPHGVYFYSVHARGTTLTHKVEIVR